jgi:hypothetical protein
MTNSLLFPRETVAKMAEHISGAFERADVLVTVMDLAMRTRQRNVMGR